MMNTPIRLIAVLALGVTLQSAFAQETPKPAPTSRRLMLLDDDQLNKFDQLWEYASGVRWEEEEKLAKKQGSKNYDRDRLTATRKETEAFNKAQSEARKFLRPSQFPVLEARREQLRQVPEYGAKQLLTWSLEEFFASPIDEEAARRWRAARAAYERAQRDATYRSDYWGFGFVFGHPCWHGGGHGGHGGHGGGGGIIIGGGHGGFSVGGGVKIGVG